MVINDRFACSVLSAWFLLSKRLSLNYLLPPPLVKRIAFICSGSFVITLCLKYIMSSGLIYHPSLFWKEIVFFTNPFQHSRSVIPHCLFYHSLVT